MGAGSSPRPKITGSANASMRITDLLGMKVYTRHSQVDRSVFGRTWIADKDLKFGCTQLPPRDLSDSYRCSNRPRRNGSAGVGKPESPSDWHSGAGCRASKWKSKLNIGS